MNNEPNAQSEWRREPKYTEKTHTHSEKQKDSQAEQGFYDHKH